jgi:predicted Zn-dependent protease
MYRSTNDSRYPFSRPSNTARTAVGSLVAAAVVVAIIVACERGRVSQPTADGSIAPAIGGDASATVASTVTAPPAAPAVPLNVSFATAESAYTTHQYPAAADMFAAYTVRRPDNAWGYYMLGLSSWHAGQLDRAEHAFDSALARDPRHVKTLVNLARVLLDENRPTQALDRAKQAVGIDSGLGDGWRVVGRAEAQLGHTDAAVAAYQTALGIDSTDMWSLNDMGLVLIDAGRYADAVGPLTRAVQLDSTVPTFGNNLGIALERSGQRDAAAQAYRGALAADSAYVKAQVSLDRVEKGAKD